MINSFRAAFHYPHNEMLHLIIPELCDQQAIFRSSLQAQPKDFGAFTLPSERMTLCLESFSVCTDSASARYKALPAGVHLPARFSEE